VSGANISPERRRVLLPSPIYGRGAGGEGAGRTSGAVPSEARDESKANRGAGERVIESYATLSPALSRQRERELKPVLIFK